MARIRTIKPTFPQSERIGRLSREARLCFILLWTQADDAGRLRGSSRMLASLLYPYDEDAPKLIEGWLSELEREGCIRRYVVDRSSYIDIPRWLEHQRIDRPSASQIPPFDELSTNPRRALDESSQTEGKGRERERDSPSVTTPAPKNGAAADAASMDLDALLFRRGKDLLGPKAGGQINKLKAAVGTGKALDIIDAAARKENPAEYVAAAIRNHTKGPLPVWSTL